MKPIYICIMTIVLGLSGIQTYSKEVFLTEIQGKYTYLNNLERQGEDYAAFGKNVKHTSDYFQQNVPIMKSNKGFDLNVILFGSGNDKFRNINGNYGLHGQLIFHFELFLKDANGKEGKWTVEPPLWEVDINNTETGHGGMTKEASAGSFLNSLFTVFPLVKEIAPGVHYYDCESRTCGSLVVFNPDRPAYWLPVTVKEVTQAKLLYYKENDEFVYNFIKPLIEKMSEEELNSPAFNQSDDGILKVNGKGEGLQYMRFNPEYWDKLLSPSAVQLLSFNYSEHGLGCFSEEDQKAYCDEYVTNNGHIPFPMEICKSLNLEQLPSLIQKKM